MKRLSDIVMPMLGVFFLALLVSHSRGIHVAAMPGAVDSGDPWSGSQTVEPAALAKELSATNRSARPAVVCVGFRPLYQGAHISGAFFHGAASTEQGIAELKSWAQTIPKSSNVVLYCGCCPLAHCPNLRPAFAALNDMGFTNVRVLILPNDFNADWIEKGYPVEKGK
jgi:rhodanese-related sulfurtransferase